MTMAEAALDRRRTFRGTITLTACTGETFQEERKGWDRYGDPSYFLRRFIDQGYWVHDKVGKKTTWYRIDKAEFDYSEPDAS